MLKVSKRIFADASIRTKLLVIILPLVIVPMLILAGVGFISSSGEASKTGSRYINQRTNDLQIIADNSAIRDYFNNNFYGLSEEAETYRKELERIFQGFVARSNAVDLVYHRVRYIHPDGHEVVVIDVTDPTGANVSAPPDVSSDEIRDLKSGDIYTSPIADVMVVAMPVFEDVGQQIDPVPQGYVIFDFVYPLDEFQNITWVLARTFLIVTAISLAIALFLGINLVRRLTDPVRRLAEISDRIAAGERAIAADIHGHDEIGRLAHSFNDMTASLRENETALRLAATELESRVKDRTRELQAANAMLEEASRHKSEFLANMSHELRTPMNAIIGFTRLVMRRSKDQLATKQYENLQKILASADHLLSLINDILDLSKIEAGRLDLHISKVPLPLLIEQCLRTVEPLVDTDKLVLESAIEDGLPEVDTDKDKLTQILMNLISNAIKFTEHGVVAVRVKRVRDEIHIDVSDTGVGIPDESIDLIFEEFRQADSSTTREYGGTGLGLSISRHLARLLGGDITVVSQLGEGSRFTLRIPVQYRDPEQRHHDAVVTAPDERPASHG